RGEVSRPVGDEAVEAGRVTRVFRLVHVPGRGVHGHRLVYEAAHVPERLRGSDPVRRHLEYVAMALGQTVQEERLLQRLLAAEPRAPRRGAARAVAQGAGEAGPGADPLAGAGVELERGGSSPGPTVVGGGGSEGRARAE